MFEKKTAANHTYEITVSIIPDDPLEMYDLSFSKIFDDLPYPPFIGLTVVVGDSYSSKIDTVTLFLDGEGDHTNIFLEPIVMKLANFEDELENIDSTMADAGWEPWPENIRPDKSN